MKKNILIVLFFMSMNSFAFEKCMNTTSRYEISLDRITLSQRLGFSDCPVSILLNGEFVRPLTRISKEDEKVLCSYGGLGISITCIK